MSDHSAPCQWKADTLEEMERQEERGERNNEEWREKGQTLWDETRNKTYTYKS